MTSVAVQVGEEPVAAAHRLRQLVRGRAWDGERSDVTKVEFAGVAWSLPELAAAPVPEPKALVAAGTTAKSSARGAMIGCMAETLRIPIAMQEITGEIIAVTDKVCAEHLDAEYARLARRLVGRLARKRPSPLARGDTRILAAGVLYVLAQVNFLFDRSQSPHMSSVELAVATDVKPTTMANKAAMINRLLESASTSRSSRA